MPSVSIQDAVTILSKTVRKWLDNNSISKKRDTPLDLNTAKLPGFYFLSSSMSYENSPLGAAEGGVLLVISDSNEAVENKNERIYQMLISHTSHNIMIRNIEDYENNVWGEWSAAIGGGNNNSTEETTQIITVSDEDYLTIDIENRNNLFDGNYISGFKIDENMSLVRTDDTWNSLIELPVKSNTNYKIALSQVIKEYDEASDSAKWLFKIIGASIEDNNIKQAGRLEYLLAAAAEPIYNGETQEELKNIIEFTTGENNYCYIQISRCQSIIVNIQETDNTEYSLETDYGNINIAQGRVSYNIANKIDSLINLNTWRLYSQSIDDCKLWEGTNQEGSLRLANEENYLGGFAGNEVMNNLKLLVDGRETPINDLNLLRNCKNITFIEKSNILANECKGRNIVSYERINDQTYSVVFSEGQNPVQITLNEVINFNGVNRVIYNITDNYIYWAIDPSDILFKRIKKLEFEKDKVRISNTWVCRKDELELSNSSIGGEYQIYKKYINGYSNNIINEYSDNMMTSYSDANQIMFYGNAFTVKLNRDNIINRFESSGIALNNDDSLVYGLMYDMKLTADSLAKDEVIYGTFTLETKAPVGYKLLESGESQIIDTNTIDLVFDAGEPAIGD